MQLDEVRAASGRTEVTSVVCFAFADMVAIRSLQPEIPGDHVQLVPGIDRDLEGLVVQLLGDAPAVIVVVHSPELSAARLEEVLVTFSKQRERNHRLCVVEFEQGAPAAFLSGVAAAVDEMRGRTPSSGSSATRRRVPTAVAASRIQARPSAIEVPDAPRESAEEPEATSEDTLSTTSPGPLDSGTTFPDLGPPISDVRRGHVGRGTRRTIWRRVAVGAVLAGVVGSLAWSGGVSGLRQSTVASSPAAGPELPARKASLTAEASPDTVSSAAASVKPSPVAAGPHGVADDAAAESRRVAAALDAKQLHALDSLLIRAGSRKPEAFADARKRCARLEVAGLQGWRLPSLDELRTLRRARMLRDGEYWSTSRVRGTMLFTLSRDRTRPQERDGSDAEDVQGLCVRQR